MSICKHGELESVCEDCETEFDLNPIATHLLEFIERECCGTFMGSHHRSSCEKYRGKFKSPNVNTTGLAPGKGIVMSYELENARFEAARNEAEDAYFAARPQIDGNDRRKVFDAGFDRARRYMQEENLVLKAALAELIECEDDHQPEWEDRIAAAFSAGRTALTHNVK